MVTTLEDFKKAIRERVFVKNTHGTPIASRGTAEESQWLFDFRAVLLQSQWLDFLAETFWARYEHQYPFQVAGLETAGIPLVAAIVMKGAQRGKAVNGLFVRKSRKRDGLMKAIEGTLTADPVILVDDLMNTGGTVNQQIAVLRDAGSSVTDVFVLLTYRDLGAYHHLAEQGVRINFLFTLADFDLPLLETRSPEIPTAAFDLVWRFRAGTPSFNWVVQKSSPILDREALYVGSDRGVFFCLNQADGKVRWQYTAGFHPKGKGIFSTPALHGNAVYFGAYDGNVYALDTQTGKKLWAFMEADWVGSSPALAPDLGLLFIGLEFGLFRKKGGIAALSLASGALAWSHQMPEHTHSSPLYIREEQAVIIGGNEKKVYCFDAKTGALRWEKEIKGDVKTSFAYDAKRRIVLFGDLAGHFLAVAVRSGKEIFSLHMTAGFYSTPLVSGDVVFASSLDKHVYAINLDDGNIRWQYATGGRIFSSPALAEGSLWVGSNDGRLRELDPSTGKLRSFFQASERVTGVTAYNTATKSFFVPTVGNEIYCLTRHSP